MNKNVEFFIACLATLMAGGALFAIDLNLTPEHIQGLIDVADAAMVLTTSQKLLDNMPAALRAPGRHLILDAAWQSRLRSLPLPPLVQLPPKEMIDRVAFVAMTSGSTGKPKGILVSHRAATVCWLARYELYPYCSDEVEVEGLNIFFTWEWLRAVAVGHSAFCVPDDAMIDPKKFVTVLRDYKVTRIMITPSLMGNILAYPSLDLPAYLARLKVIYLEGEVTPASLAIAFAKRCPSVHLVNVYGTWEGLDITYTDLSPVEHYLKHCRFAPAGMPMPTVRIRIVDPQSMQPTMLGVPGEIVVTSPALAMGYLKDPERTAEKFFPSPFPEDAAMMTYRTGDAGRIRPDGRLEVMGRRGLEIKIRGFKVGLEFVEAAIRSIEGVIATVVQPVLDEYTGQPYALSAYIVSENGKPGLARLQSIQEQLREKVPEYAVPVFWIPMDAIPTLPGLKADRKALPPPQPEHRISKANVHAEVVGVQPQTADANLETALLEVWKKVLGTGMITVLDNFFEIGGHSLAASEVVALLTDQFGLPLTVLDLYQHPTIQSLVDHLSPNNDNGSTSDAPIRWGAAPRVLLPHQGRVDIAVVGMAIRVPGANTLDEFWHNLVHEVCSVRHYSRDELLARGVSSEIVGHEDFVRVGYACDDIDKFDHAFWGIGKQEALLMDPQQRLFLEVAWHALENAGYAPRTGTTDSCGVFAACGIDGYLVHHLEGGGLHKPLDPGEWFLTEIGNEKDYISTRVSYQMNLGGPSMTINSACSSGLVAIAMAAQAIRSGQCSMALAGASSLTFPHFGYLYSEGLVASPDGLVRPFDQGANGTVFGDGVGCVVLKRLDLAVQDGDVIYSVLRGSAVTNDGAIKAGYTAPGVNGQKSCISTAMLQAEVTASEVSYVECHATATNIGDAIEIRGLSEAFKLVGPNDTPTALGSVKGNIAHANCAAGVTGFIKASLCLHHSTLVRTCHFNAPSEKLPLAQTGFYVNTELRKWEAGSDGVPEGPLMCGVSSFGIGGTNAHIVLSEAPSRSHEELDRLAPIQESEPVHVLVLSAKTRESLQRQAVVLARYLEQADSALLEDVVYTLHVGREQFEYRLAITAQSKSEAIAKLNGELTIVAAKAKASVAMVFPGQGSQYLQMGLHLYSSNHEYRACVDTCCAILKPMLQLDIREALFAPQSEESQNLFSRPSVLQPAIFVTEYGLAKVLMSFGIRPVALAGHSIGEYVASTIAGVVSVEDALGLIATRALATERQAQLGAMLSIVATEQDATSYVEHESAGNLTIAAYNSPTHFVLSGTVDAVEAAGRTLSDRGIRTAPLRVNRAFHSPMMQVSP